MTPISFSGSIPDIYEKYSGQIVFEPFALDIVTRVKEPGSMLELACGTGRVTNHLVKLLPSGATMYATDISADMLEKAKTIVKDGRVNWMKVDAHSLPFSDGMFDHVICQFGVMFFADKPRAFSEIHRVLKNKGRFIFNVWDSLDNNPRSALVVRVVNDFFGSVPEAMTLPASFYRQDEITSLLRAAGFTAIAFSTVKKEIRYPTVEDITTPFLLGPLAQEFFSTVSPAKKEEFEKLLRSELVKEYGEKDIISSHQAICCEAER